MAQIKDLGTDKTQRKPKFGQNPRNQVKKKNYFGQKFLELEQLDTSTNDAI